MPRRKRRRPNWPYRLAWLTIIGVIIAYIAVGTLVSVGGVHRDHWQRDWTIALVARCLDATFAIWFVAVGASIGSFLNVVAYRLPLGRTLGGHSACPFCCTRILGVDNVPVLAWLRLRGRCRACHLPISPQYPLVELAVAMVFLFVYLTEFSIAGDNLPGLASGRHGMGFVWTNINQRIVLRTMLHLFVVSGLIGAALIAIHGRTVPLKLYGWLLSILCVSVVAIPELIVVPWWPGSRSQSGLDLRFDALLTIVCGLVAGVALARVLAPLLFHQFDQKLLNSDAATVSARQWMGAMGAAGAAAGWQAAILVAWLALLCQLVGVLVSHGVANLAGAAKKSADNLNLADSTVWVWCGLLLMRANWKKLVSLELPGADSMTVYWYLLAVGLLAPVCWCIRICSEKPMEIGNSTSLGDEIIDPESMENHSCDDTLEDNTIQKAT